MSKRPILEKEELPSPKRKKQSEAINNNEAAINIDSDNSVVTLSTNNNNTINSKTVCVTQIQPEVSPAISGNITTALATKKSKLQDLDWYGTLDWGDRGGNKTYMSRMLGECKRIYLGGVNKPDSLIFFSPPLKPDLSHFQFTYKISQMPKDSLLYKDFKEHYDNLSDNLNNNDCAVNEGAKGSGNKKLSNDNNSKNDMSNNPSSSDTDNNNSKNNTNNSSDSESNANGINGITFELRIPPTFPLAPPAIRVLYPKLSGPFLFRHGAICFEALTPQGWITTMSLEALCYAVVGIIQSSEGRPVRVDHFGDPVTKEIKEYNEKDALKEFEHINKAHKNGTSWGQDRKDMKS